MNSGAVFGSPFAERGAASLRRKRKPGIHGHGGFKGTSRNPGRQLTGLLVAQIADHRALKVVLFGIVTYANDGKFRYANGLALRVPNIRFPSPREGER